MKKMNSKGFTLIELLIVVAIIAILAAIAIPQFAQYRLKGYNSSALTDLRNARTTEEALFADFQRYGRSAAAALPGAGGAGVGAVLTGPGVPATPNILTLTDSQAVNRGIQTPTGNNVTMVVSTDAAAAPSPGMSTYNIASKHLQGDTTYGADAESTATYRNSILHAVAVAVAAGDEAPAAISPTTDSFAGAANWAAL